MSILMASALSVGNAVRLVLDVPPGTVRTRVLRANAVDYIGGPFDAAAAVVADGELGRSVVDISCQNGTQYWYQAYHLIADVWVEGGTLVTAIPSATYVDNSVDALSLVRDRLEAGFKAELARGSIKTASGRLPVLTAPPAFDDKSFPFLTVHLSEERPGERFLGESIGGDIQEESGDWLEQEGWLAGVSLEVIAWSLNPDERIELRKALRRLLVANLAVFDSFGINSFTPTFSDAEELEAYGPPVYQVMCTISCNAPVAVGGPASAIDDVTVTVTEETA